MASKRETLKNPSGTFYTRRDAGGHFSEHDEKGKSLKSDRRVKAKTVAKKGRGDEGDQKTSSSRKTTARTRTKKSSSSAKKKSAARSRS
jgi:hypothetical protein